jgi:hypothetical protein
MTNAVDTTRGPDGVVPTCAANAMRAPPNPGARQNSSRYPISGSDVLTVAIIFLWVLIGFIPAMIADSKGHSFILWWIYGSLLFPIAFFHALSLPSDRAARDVLALRDGGKRCRHCAEIIRQEAVVCRFCGRDV